MVIVICSPLRREELRPIRRDAVTAGERFHFVVVRIAEGRIDKPDSGGTDSVRIFLPQEFDPWFAGCLRTEDDDFIGRRREVLPADFDVARVRMINPE